VTAFMALMGLGPSLVAPVCVQGLFNLTCGEWHACDKVIKSLVNLPFTDKIDPRPVICNAMLNCALIFRLRPRLIEEGCIQIMETFVTRMTHSTSSLVVCSKVLYQLSCSRTCRSDMVVKGAVKCIKLLSSIVNEEIHYYCACALSKLSLDSSSRHRMIDEGR